jgi:beta-lactamase regulating signal transducer with metallopeptidase domain
MIEPVLTNDVARSIAWALLQFIWQGTFAGLFVMVALAALRGRSAQTRYVAACVGLIVMLALPINTVVQNLPIVRNSTTDGPQPVAAQDIPKAAREVLTRVTPTSIDRYGTWAVQNVESWLPFIFLVWLTGVVALSLRMLTGWIFVERLRKTGRPLPENVVGCVRKLASTLRISKPVRVFESTLIKVPTVIGSLRPVILLPASALTGLSPTEIEAVLAHELAHIQRHDYLVNVLQTAVETLLFYHPAVWLISNRIRIEREHCCDDLAVSVCGDRFEYARALANLEGLRLPATDFAMRATGGSLSTRIRRLLDVPAAHRRFPTWPAFLVIMGLIALAVTPNGAAGSRSEVPASASPGPPDEKYNGRYRGTDYELRQTLASVSERELTSADIRSLLRRAKQISSDYELAEFLIALGRNQRLEGVRDSYFDTLSSISSDYEHRRVLSALSGYFSDPALTAAMLKSLSDIDSDYEAAEFLISVAEFKVTESISELFFRAVSSLSSDYERGRVLTAAIAENLSPETLTMLLRSTDGMSSDTELASLLVKIAQRYHLQGSLRNAYLQATDRMSSQTEKNRVLAALVRSDGGR